MKKIHNRIPKPYWNKDWLITEYIIFERDLSDIAGQCGVSESAVRYFLIKYDIPIRTNCTHWPLSDYFLGTFQVNRPKPDIKIRTDWIPKNHKELLNSLEWREFKKLIHERDNYTCQRCGRIKGTMIVHHILPFYWRIGVFDPKYCILLCSACHKWVHNLRTNNTMLFLASPIGRRVYFDPRVYQNFEEGY